MSGAFTKDSEPRQIPDEPGEIDLNDPVALLIHMLIYSPPADPIDEYYAQYAQARVNAYVYIRKNGIGGNPLDPLDIASCVEI
jgi:hypothetical protein